MRQKITAGAYHALHELTDDLYLMYDNAFKFNPEGERLTRFNIPVAFSRFHPAISHWSCCSAPFFQFLTDSSEHCGWSLCRLGAS